MIEAQEIHRPKNRHLLKPDADPRGDSSYFIIKYLPSIVQGQPSSGSRSDLDAESLHEMGVVTGDTEPEPVHLPLGNMAVVCQPVGIF